ncbi:MAG: hypothetical protein IJV06_10800 [Bacteroidaceae bacterium]|nr:hypothetical protein [Bacteroidaceae bacterium]
MVRLRQAGSPWVIGQTSTSFGTSVDVPHLPSAGGSYAPCRMYHLRWCGTSTEVPRIYTPIYATPMVSLLDAVLPWVIQ